MTAISERRAHRRWPGWSARVPPGIRLRTGHLVRVLDLAPGGASIETDARMAPGVATDLVIVSGGMTRVTRSTVIYARVSGLHPTHGARYRVGLRLDGAVFDGNDRPCG